MNDAGAPDLERASAGLTDGGPTSENPLAQRFAFDISVPPLTVRMVNASALEEYELWLFCASLAFGAVTGFGVAYIQSTEGSGGGDAATGIAAIVFLVLFVAFFSRAFVLRRRLSAASRTYRMNASQVEIPGA